MRMRLLLPCLIAAATLFASGAQAQTKITVGKIIGGSGFHIPSYVAMDQGFFKAEGLDASFVTLQGRALVTAGLSGSVDFIPIPSGGAQAALSGAEIRYVVGESLKSHWVIAARPGIDKPEDLRGKTVGYGRAGSADYDEGAAVMLRAFKMAVGKDYKVISFPGENERIAAMVNGDIQAALISVPHVPKVMGAGMKVLLRTGDYIQRAGGMFWTMKSFVDKNPDATKKFIRAIARGVMFFRDNKQGSLATLKEHFSVDTDQDATIVWEETSPHVWRRAAQGSVRRYPGVAAPDHDRRQAVAGRQAAARPGAIRDPGAAGRDAEGNELRPDQARRPDLLRCKVH